MSLEYERKGNEGEERGTGVWEERKVKRGENGAISNNKEIKDSDVPKYHLCDGPTCAF